MADLVGMPSDDCPDVLAAGRAVASILFVSMSTRHPDGHDADYLRWHSFDHRPEQHRLAGVRHSLRLVSTPGCRAARAAAEPPYDAIDHVMTYFFTDTGDLEGFNQLSVALDDAGRKPYLLPAVDRDVLNLAGMAAAARIKVGADVLPWWPARGVYLLVERGQAPAVDLTAAAGVGGAWWTTVLPLEVPGSHLASAGTQVTYLFLDGDPVDTAEALRPALAARWEDGQVVPLFAAPFYTLIPQEPDRYLPS